MPPSADETPVTYTLPPTPEPPSAEEAAELLAAQWEQVIRLADAVERAAVSIRTIAEEARRG